MRWRVSSSAARMKKLIALIVLVLVTMLYVGYYQALDDGDIETILFVKKHPTFQVKFYNIHANDGEIRQVERLTEQERKWIIDYCRYRLGIDTDLKTQNDVEICRKKIACWDKERAFSQAFSHRALIAQPYAWLSMLPASRDWPPWPSK